MENTHDMRTAFSKNDWGSCFYTKDNESRSTFLSQGNNQFKWFKYKTRHSENIKILEEYINVIYFKLQAQASVS